MATGIIERALSYKIVNAVYEVPIVKSIATACLQIARVALTK